MKNSILLFGTLSAIGIGVSSAQSTWNGATTDWATATNWSPGLPASGDGVIIADAAPDAGVVLDTSRTIGSLTYGTTGTRITGFTMNTQAANTLTLNSGINAGGAWAGGATALLMRGNYLVAADQVWTAGGSSAHATDQGINIREITAASVKGKLTLNGKVTKEGAGQLMFVGIDVAGAGDLVVNAGDLKFNAGSTLLLDVGGTGKIIMNNASTLAVYKNSGTMNITRDLEMNGTSSLVGVNAGVVIASKTTWSGTHTLNLGSTTTLSGAWLGAGTVNRSGAGVATLSGNLTGFSGVLNASAGTTVLSGNFGGTVNASATGAIGGEGTVTGNITMNGGGFSVDPTTAGALSTAGNLSLTGTTAVSVTATPLSAAPFTVVNYAGTLTGTAANLSLPGAYRAPVFSTATPKTITLSVGSENRTWKGPAGGAWDTNVSSNWAEGDNKFYNFDAVIFGDTGAGTVAITGVLNPKSITVNSTADYNFTAAANNLIAGSTSLTKSGTGTTTLAGVNTFTGGVNITGGVLKVGGNQALGANGQVITVSTGGTLDLNGLQSASRDYAAVIAGIGATGTGAIVNTGAGQNFGFGKITLAADATVGGTGRIDLRPITAGNGVLDLNGKTLTKTGTNNFAIVDSQVTAAGSINATQGQFSFTRSVVSGAGSINMGSGTLLMLENNTSGTITKAIALDGATLQNQGAVFTVGSNVSLSGAVTSNTVTDLTLTGSLSGTGSMTKTGAGKLILNGATSNYSGSATISAGMLQVNGSVAFSSVSIAAGATLSGNGGAIAGMVDTVGPTSVIAPGASPGTLAVGSLNVADGASFQFELGTSQDLLNVTGALTGGGALSFAFSNSGGLAPAQPYTLINYASQTGLTYANLSAGTLPAGVVLDPSYGTGGWSFDNTSLKVQFVPEPSNSLLGLGGLLLLTSRRRARL